MPLHEGEASAATGIEADTGSRYAPGAEADEDRPLREDTRLLGRILGDTAEDVIAGIHLTINGIAAGLRNSG